MISEPGVAAAAGDSFGEDLMLFDDDRGRLPAAARRALVWLIKQTHLAAITHPGEWEALLAYRDDITTVLNELFLVVKIDESLGVAWVQQAVVDETVASYTLLRSPRLTVVQVRIMIDLHRRLADARIQGHSVAVVRGGEILDALAEHYPPDKGDHTAHRRFDGGQVRTLAKDDILIAPHGSGSDDVEDIIYTISPIVAAILTPARLVEYTAVLEREADLAKAPDGAGQEPIDLDDDLDDGQDLASDHPVSDDPHLIDSLFEEEDQQ